MSLTIKFPNKEIRAAMVEADAIARSHNARFTCAYVVFDDPEKNNLDASQQASMDAIKSRTVTGQ